jgi:hypothetical protein
VALSEGGRGLLESTLRQARHIALSGRDHQQRHCQPLLGRAQLRRDGLRRERPLIGQAQQGCRAGAQGGHLLAQLLGVGGVGEEPAEGPQQPQLREAVQRAVASQPLDDRLGHVSGQAVHQDEAGDGVARRVELGQSPAQRVAHQHRLADS